MSVEAIEYDPQRLRRDMGQLVTTSLGPPNNYYRQPSEVAGGEVLVLSLLALGGMLWLGAKYNKWAYGDWTCMFKNCVQTSQKR